MSRIQVSMGAWADGYANVNGVRLHYAASGAPGKPLLLFVHGFPEFWYAWKHQLEAFGENYYAVALDMRGYNLSSKPETVEQYKVKHLVEDLRALAEHFGYARFHLVGHDWGGAAAWAFGIAHPRLLQGLVIVNAPHPAVFARELQSNPAQRTASQYMLMFRSPEAEAVLSANNYAALVKVIPAGARKEEYLKAWSQPGALTGGLNYYRASRIGPGAASFVAGSTTVNVPTLVIWGEKDSALLPGNLDGLEEFVPGVRIERIPDATHWVVHEKPGLVNVLIREFVVRTSV